MLLMSTQTEKIILPVGLWKSMCPRMLTTSHEATQYTLYLVTSPNAQ